MSALPEPMQGPNQALLTGEICGALQAAGFNVRPVADTAGNYLPRLLVQRPSGWWAVVVEPEVVIET